MDGFQTGGDLYDVSPNGLLRDDCWIVVVVVLA